MILSIKSIVILLVDIRLLGQLFIISMSLTLISYSPTSAQVKPQVIRIAKLQIDAAQLEQYKAALKEEIETSLHVEAGVLTLYAVADKEKPTSITVFEIYAHQEAYKSHIESPHFIKYKTTTKDMVKSLELMEASPIAMKTKKK